MSRKLIRNTSTEESRNWWKAIEAAARNAPRLDVMPESTEAAPTRGGKARPGGSSTPRSKKK